MNARQRKSNPVKHLRSESYMGWRIRKMKVMSSGLIFWQTDNNRRPPYRERKGWKSVEEARSHIQAKSAEVKNHGLGAYALSHAQRIEAQAAFEKLGGKVALADVLKFWQQHHPDGSGVSLSTMAGEWIASQEKDGLMPTTIRQNRQRLGVFTQEMGEDTACAVVTPEKARAFLDGRDCGKVTRESWRKTLRAFFGFCVERKMVEVNPVPENKRRKGAKVSQKSIPDFMRTQMVERFMAKAEELHPESVPALAVMFFAGLRPFEVGGQYGLESPEVTEARAAVVEAKKWLEEAKRRGIKASQEARVAVNAAREKLAGMLAAAKKDRRNSPATMGGLNWSNVNLSKRFIRVLGETSKTGAARLVDISDNLLLWLAKYRKASGPVAPTPPTFKRHRQDIMAAVGLKAWLPDVARHTYATHHFAMWENQDKLQAQMGHAGKAYVLTNHYKGLATKAEAEAFWNIEPAGAKGAAQGRTLQLAAKGA